MKQIRVLATALVLISFHSSASETNNLSLSAGPSVHPTRENIVELSAAAKDGVAAEARNQPTAPSYVPDAKYKLRTGDRVSFQILEDREAPRNLVVADSGELEVPYLGRIPAVDKTCKELAAEIKTQLEKEYYYRASVVLALDAANRVLGRVYIWGQVRSQGPIEVAVNENLTAGKAILRAGGFGDFANKKKIKVIRPGTHGAPKQVFELNMVEILEDGQTEKDLPLQSDDSVIVASRLINF